MKLVISGGQSSADQVGWRAAQACGIPNGGWMPFGFLTEEGTRRWFSNLYQAREMPTKSYPARTVKNVQESDGTLWFGTTDTTGAKTTLAVGTCAAKRAAVSQVYHTAGFTLSICPAGFGPATSSPGGSSK
jgi:hypothetical protein